MFIQQRYLIQKLLIKVIFKTNNLPKYQNPVPWGIFHRLLEHVHNQQDILPLAIPGTPTAKKTTLLHFVQKTG